MKNKKKSRLIAFLMSCAFLAFCFPSSAFAQLSGVATIEKIYVSKACYQPGETAHVEFLVNNPGGAMQGSAEVKISYLENVIWTTTVPVSLDANAYAWVLMSRIADVLGTSREEVYEEMLRRYGVLYEDEEGCITVTVKAEVDMGKVGGHWLLLKKNGKYAAYAMIKGSSEYDTREMSRFIDGVVSEAKELSIETLTPRELQEMKAGWAP